jgi:hypothetical protein
VTTRAEMVDSTANMQKRGRLARVGAVARAWTRLVKESPSAEVTGDFLRWSWTTFVDPDLLAAELPWTTFSATRWLDRALRQDMRVFEWGSGGSTLFFARRVRSVVTVEHDPDWHRQVADRVDHKGVKNVDLRLVLPNPARRRAESSTLPHYRSSVPQFSSVNFVSYVESIASEPDGSLDLVMIDGRARASCAAVALKKIRRTGALVIDDSDRDDTVPALALFEPPEWTVLHFAGPGPASRWPVSWRTSVFVRQ